MLENTPKLMAVISPTILWEAPSRNLLEIAWRHCTGCTARPSPESTNPRRLSLPVAKPAGQEEPDMFSREPGKPLNPMLLTIPSSNVVSLATRWCHMLYGRGISPIANFRGPKILFWLFHYKIRILSRQRAVEPYIRRRSIWWVSHLVFV